MGRYEELVGRVVSLETDFELFKSRQGVGLSKSELLSRVNTLEDKVLSLKGDLIADCAQEAALAGEVDICDVSGISAVVEDTLSVEELTNGFKVRAALNQGRTVMANHSVQSAKSMEFKIGKTVMSVLASVLVLFSIVLFGRLVYPYLSDIQKVMIMYGVSLSFTLCGLFGRERKFKTFFTATAGCGVGCLYLSGVISYFLYQDIGLISLFVLTYVWVVLVGVVARKRVPVFTYICYIGILISTVLCVFEFWNSWIALGCYLLGVVTLYCVVKSGNCETDRFFFAQAPIVLGALIGVYYADPIMIMWIMLACTVVYVLQYYLYHGRVHGLYKWCLVGTSAVLFFGCKLTNWGLHASQFYNVFYVILSLVVAVWSYMLFSDRFLKVIPVAVMCFTLPVLSWGSFYENYISYIPFVAGIILIGYLLDVNLIKGTGAGYFILYALSKPSGLSWQIFYFMLVVTAVELGCLYYFRCFERRTDRIGVMAVFVVVLTVLCSSDLVAVEILSYMVAVLLSCFFNSHVFVKDDVSLRLGWMWNGYWLAFGTAVITGSSDWLRLTMFFVMVLVSYMVNARWQIQCGHPFASLWLCIKGSLYLWMLLDKLALTGAVTSILFLMLAVWGIVFGALVRRKAIRLYGLVLSILSVLKCLLFDIAYSSSLYRPLGLLVAGIMCFGISWIYTVIEKKLGVE